MPKITEKGRVVPIGGRPRCPLFKIHRKLHFLTSPDSKTIFFVNKKFDKFDIKEMKREKRK